MAVPKFSFYRYDPSIALAATFAVLFGISTVLHIWQLVRKRTWYFIPFVIGGLCEVIGYVGRILSANQKPDYTLGPYIVQSLCLLIAPALFAASIYMVLGRIIRRVEGEKYSPIRVAWLTKLFVTADIICFLLQGAGGGILAQADGDESKYSLGENIIIAGLFVQLTAFTLFIVAAGVFHLRLARNPTPASQRPGVPWRRFLLVLYAVSLLILVRSIFRAVEYFQGYAGQLQSAEYYLYIFDSALMLVAMVVLNVWHPSGVVSGRAAEDKYSGMGSVDSGFELRREEEGKAAGPGHQGYQGYQG